MEEKKEMKEKTDNSQKSDKNTLKEYFQLKDVLTYFFRRKDPERPTSFNLKAMHGINKISMIVFLLGIIFIILKRVL